MHCDPSGTCDQFFFLLEIPFRQLRVCYFVVPTLTRGLACNLLYNCFWTYLARAATLQLKSCRTHGHILPSRLRLPQSGGPGPRIYIPPGTGWPSYTSGHWVPLCRLLRLARLLWRYSNPPPQGFTHTHTHTHIYIVQSSSLENREYGSRETSL
jgi:hypothetical protein